VSDILVSQAGLQADDFTLFDLPRQFALDRAAVDARWKAMQREAHPDRFAAQGASAQRIAMQWSVRINEAYQRLKEPLSRAAYLCELAGVPVQAQTNTAMPAQFLMQQMEWREELEAANTSLELDAIVEMVERERIKMLQQCEHALDVAHEPAQAVSAVRSLMFIYKFLQDVHQRIDQIS